VTASVAVADSSALIAFHQIGRLELLQAVLGRVAVPPAVAREVAPSLGALPAWVEVRRAPPHPALPTYLDDGERDAIALALHLGASTIVLDELPGRRVAMGLGLEVVGSLGLLVRAKRAGLIHDVRPIMDAMLFWGLFASDSLYRQILAAAGELD
jgi:predicted nucleic acid-binding protein